MSVRFYFDHNVHGAVVRGLRSRGVDVLLAFEDGAHELPDHELLDRAALLGRVLYSNDDDLLREARSRQEDEKPFPGLVYVHPLRLGIGEQIDELELIGKAVEPGELVGRVVFLPIT